MVRRRRSWLTAARTCSTFEGVVAVLGRPDRSSLAVEVLDSWNAETTQKFGYGSCTNHQKPVSTFQKFYFPFYPISHRTWCTPFVRQLPSYRRYQKIALIYLLHLSSNTVIFWNKVYKCIWNLCCDFLYKFILWLSWTPPPPQKKKIVMFKQNENSMTL